MNEFIDQKLSRSNFSNSIFLILQISQRFHQLIRFSTITSILKSIPLIPGSDTSPNIREPALKIRRKNLFFYLN